MLLSQFISHAFPIYRYLQLGLRLLISLVICFSLAQVPIIAAPSSSGDLSRQPPIEAKVSLGNRANELKFFPSNIEFSAGKRYKLVLNNPSASKHYFTAKDFADNIWSQKVEAGNVEVKGAIHELELKPKATAEWVFVPIKPGVYELHCSVPGHTEAGMVGKLTVSVHPNDA